ncbi:MAG: SprB repeat-containing protein, partial [Bacteroidota bacterium]
MHPTFGKFSWSFRSAIVFFFRLPLVAFLLVLVVYATSAHSGFEENLRPSPVALQTEMPLACNDLVYTVDFLADQASLNINDCGVLESDYTNYFGTTGSWDNIVEVNSTDMLFVDVEGTNCTGNAGGDNSSTYFTNPIDISAFCYVEFEASFSFVNVSDFPGAPSLECQSGIGMDFLQISYSTDGGTSYSPIDPAYAGQGGLTQFPSTSGCQTGAGSGTGTDHVVTSGGILVPPSGNVSFLIEFGSQSVTEGIQIEYIRIFDRAPEFTAATDVSLCQPSFTLPPISGSCLTGNEMYFTGPMGTGTSLSPGSSISASGTYFIFDPTAPCNESSFQVNIGTIPDGDAGTDGAATICSGDVIDLLAVLGPGVTPGAFADDDGSGVDLSNPTNVDFGGVPDGVYNFTYTTTDDPSTPCPPVSAVATITVEPAPFVSVPSIDLEICYNFLPPFLSANVDEVIEEINGSSGDDVNFFFDPAGTQPFDPLSLSDIQQLIFSGQTTIYAQAVTGNCTSAIVPVSIVLTNRPEADAAGPLSVCNDGSGIGAFDLNSLSSTINGGSGDAVNFYTDAALQNPILTNPFLSGTTTVFATVGSNTCQSEEVAIQLIVLQQLMLDCQVIANSSTPTSNDGVANINISGGAPNYSLVVNGPNGSTTIDPANGSETLNNLAPGNYTVTVTDSEGCLAAGPCTFTIDIDQTCVVQVLTDLQDPTCNGGTDGFIELTILDAAGPIGIQWSIPGFDDQTLLPNLGQGSYSVTVTDNGTANCQVEILNLDLFEPPPILLNCSESQAESPAGAGNGQALLTISDAIEFITLNITGPISQTINNQTNGTLVIDNLTAGNYQVELIDGNGCTANCSFEITAVTPSCSNLSVSPTIIDVSCASGNDGAILLTVSGNNQAVTIDWDEPSLPDNFTIGGLTPGTYTATIFEGGFGNCPTAVSYTLNPPPDLDISCTVIANSSTPTSNDGAASVDLNGSISTYILTITGPSGTFVINPATDPQILAGLPPGDYTVEVTDTDGCTAPAGPCNFTIGVDQNCTLAVTPSITDPICNGENTGQIELMVSGALGPLTIQWSILGFDDQTIASGLGSGDYSVIITDTGGDNCQVNIDDIELVDPPAPMLNCNQIQAESQTGASDGQAQISISDAVEPVTLVISGPVNQTLTNQTNGNTFLNGLPGGNYQVELTDGNGCMATCTFNISTDTPSCSNINVDINIDPVSCAGDDGSASIIVIGNVQPVIIDWDDPTLPDDFNLTGLSAGTYTGTIFEGGFGNCPTPISITLLTPPDATINCNVLSEASGPAVEDGSAEVIFTSGTPPYQITIQGNGQTNTSASSDNSFQFDNLGVSVYTVTVVDDNDCSQTCNFTIQQASCTLDLDFSATNIGCTDEDNGSITLFIDGNQGTVTIDWDDDTYDGQQDLTGLTEGEYNVTVTDQVGCFLSLGPISIINPEELEAICSEFQPISNPNGDDGQINLNITGGTGPYTIEVSSSDPGFSVTQIVDTPGDYQFGPYDEDAYEFLVTDASGCTSDCVWFLLGPPCPAITINQNLITPVSCFDGNDGAISVTVSGGTEPYFYQWSPSLSDTNFVEGLTAGQYILVVFDADSCTAAQSFVVDQPTALPTLNCQVIADESTPNANDGIAEVTTSSPSDSIELILSGPDTNQSFTAAGNGNQTFDNLAPGDYQVDLIDGNCDTLSCTFTIGGVDCNVDIDVSAVDSTICEDACLELNLDFSGTGPFNMTYFVYGQGDTIPNLALATAFQDTVLDFCIFQIVLPNLEGLVITSVGNIGCSIDTFISVPLLSGVSAPQLILDPTDANCSQAGTITTTISGSTFTPFSYDWSDDGLDGQPDPIGLDPGQYSLTITDALGCQDSAMTIINLIDDAPMVNATTQTSIVCANECLILDLELTGLAPFSVEANIYDEFLPPINIIFDQISGDTSISSCELSFDLTQYDSIEIITVADNLCDSDTSIVIAFDIVDNTTIDSSGTFCTGDQVIIGGQIFDATNPSDTFTVAGGVGNCDTLYQVDLNFLPAQSIIDTLDQTICLGDSILIGNTQFDAANPEGLTVITPGNSNICDSSLYVRLSFLNPAFGSFTSTACAGDTVLVEGTAFTIQDPDGLVTIFNGAANGCDSLLSVIINFTIPPEVELMGD